LRMNSMSPGCMIFTPISVSHFRAPLTQKMISCASMFRCQKPISCFRRLETSTLTLTLSGHVASYAEKLAAIAAVRRIRGVRAIAEEIDVRYVIDKKTSDDEIAKRTVDILGWDTMVPSGSIQVMVRDGWITLTGNADWYYQKKAAEDDVRKLSGARGVINNIHIRPHVRPDDVKQKIEDALKRHAEIEAKAIRISVHGNDRVVLEGEVDNWDEKYAVETAAWSAGGVKSVEDRLTIR
jgi:osmotically-inducible protein OsmY